LFYSGFVGVVLNFNKISAFPCFVYSVH